MSYLEEAAALLRQAVKTNEEDNKRYLDLLNRNRVELAREFAGLAAIANGVVPDWMAADILNRIAGKQEA
jgi:hypothetical protein